MNANRSACILAIFVLVLGVMPETIAGVSNSVAEFTTVGVTIVGSAAVTGSLVALTSTAAPTEPVQAVTGDPERAGPDQLVLGAMSVHAETDHGYYNYTIAGAAAQTTTSLETREFSNVQVTAAASNPYTRYFVLPTQPGSARATLEMTSGSLGFSDGNTARSGDFIGRGRPETSVATDGAGKIESSEWQILRIEGNFTLVLWAWDAVATVEGTQTPLPSGPVWTSTAPEALPVRTVGSEHDRQVYLTATNGVLDLTFSTPPAAKLYLAPTQMQATGRLTFNDVTGSANTPDGTVPVQAATLEVTGRLQANFAPDRSHGFQTTLTGIPEKLSFGGHEYLYPALEAPVSSSQISLLWLWPLALVVPPAVAVARQRRLKHQLEGAKTAMANGAYDTAMLSAKPLLKARAVRKEAALVVTLSALKVGSLDVAGATLDRAGLWTGQRAIRAYLRGHLDSLNQDWTAAAASIKECLEQAPEMLVEILGNPTLAGAIPRLVAMGLISPRMLSEGYA